MTGADSMSGLIYPLPLKQPSGINSWDGWPDDVRDTLWAWNHRAVEGHTLASRLTFVRSTGVFKCDCGEFCVPHRNGAAVLDGEWLCDDCLIARARAASGSPPDRVSCAAASHRPT